MASLPRLSSAPALGPLALLLLACALYVIGCEEDEIRAYRVAKSDASAPLIARPAHQEDLREQDPWSAPEGWRRVASDEPMRYATFLTGNSDDALEVAVTRFPGDVGGVLANVNRWRGQIGLAPVEEAALAGMLEPFDNGGFRGFVMRFDAQPQGMLGAIIHEESAARTWFVKAVAPGATLDAHETSVFRFARSFGEGGDEA